jgi:hypothetical protein
MMPKAMPEVKLGDPMPKKQQLRVRDDQPPVVVRHPITEEFVTVRAGDVYDSDHPVAKSFAWAFEGGQGQPGDGAAATVEQSYNEADIRVEQATSSPGERRNTRRPKKEAEPVEPKKDEGSGNGPIRSDSI